MKTILYVEDDPVLRKACVKAFQNDRLKILEADNVHNALDVIDRAPPDLLVTGLSMPLEKGKGVVEMSGFSTLKHIQEKGYDFPVLMLDNIQDKDVIQKAINLGAKAYFVLKDMTLPELRAVALNYLSSPSKNSPPLTGESWFKSREKYKIRLRDSREIFLDELHQCETYAGLLAGIPDKDMNGREIVEALKRTSGIYQARKGKLHIIMPIYTEIIRPITDEESASIPPAVSKKISQQKYECIPTVTSMAIFTSNKPVNDSNCDGSSLKVIWFQDRFGLPTDEALSELKNVNWNDLATDWSW